MNSGRFGIAMAIGALLGAAWLAQADAGASKPVAVAGGAGEAKTTGVAAQSAGLPEGVLGFVETGGTAPALDGSLKGWEKAIPHRFKLDENSVEARCMFDASNLYLRMHLCKGYEISEPTRVFDAARMFTHENMRDEVSFYFQGDPGARGGGEHGRPGDFRIVFAVIQDDNGVEKAAALGMFQHWDRPGGLSVEYWSPVRTETFKHVALLEKAELGHVIDADRKGFVIAARIPASELTLRAPLKAGLRTRADFSATVGGITKFWWVNTGRMDATFTTDEPSEAKIFPGAWGPAWFLGPDGK